MRSSDWVVVSWEGGVGCGGLCVYHALAVGGDPVCEDFIAEFAESLFGI
jgi:hypothetical protein